MCFRLLDVIELDEQLEAIDSTKIGIIARQNEL